MFKILEDRAITRRFLAIVLTIPIYLGILVLGAYLILDGQSAEGIALIGIPSTAASMAFGFFFQKEANGGDE